MPKRILVALVVLAVGGVGLMSWELRPGTFSYFNYCRISPGMRLADVEDLLGGRGMSVTQAQLPGTGEGPVVSGDEYFLWMGGDRWPGGKVIFVSMKEGAVAEKWYWEPSW